MEARLFSFWIIIVVSEVLLCLGAPFQPDPFRGMDSEVDPFEMDLMERLGVKDPSATPSIDRKDIVIPDHIYAKYSSLLKHHRMKRKTITQGVRENPGIRGRVVSASQSRHVYTFDMSSLPAGSEVMMAELRIYKELPNHSIHKPNATHRHGVTGGLTSLHQVTTNNSQGGGDSPSTLCKVDERVINLDSFGWKNFDATAPVTQWLETPSTNLGLELHVDPVRSGSYARRVAERVHFSPEEEPDHEERGVPMLIVYTIKYAPIDDPVDCSTDGSDSDRCCRIPKHVDFRRTSWTNRWIIEPAGFESYDCAGPCQRSHHSRRTLRDVFGLRPGSYQTCGVARFSSLPMMYLIERGGVSELEVEEIPNMIVDECECTA
ncbi:left-right determination factor 1-like [Asterias rubens]|uniref:left-right determination factor 1-like n=1 Tax=Asterias rubens TaxID=7604 RepID=UPI001455465F|nr:left-right determination factor 1-like [Asterias rubens]